MALQDGETIHNEGFVGCIVDTVLSNEEATVYVFKATMYIFKAWIHIEEPWLHIQEAWLHSDEAWLRSDEAWMYSVELSIDFRAAKRARRDADAP